MSAPDDASDYPARSTRRDYVRSAAMTVVIEAGVVLASVLVAMMIATIVLLVV